LIVGLPKLAYGALGEERAHDCRDAGGRATPGAVALEQKLQPKLPMEF